MGVRDIPLALLAPRRFFARVEDVPLYAWPLLILLTTVTLLGWARVQTGLIDLEVERSVQARIAELERVQRDVVERSALRAMIEQQYKQATFEKLLSRIQAIVARPVAALAQALLIAATLYGVVALSGRKPEWNTLLTICVFAGFADAARLLAELAMMIRFGTLDVYTSLAPLLVLMPGRAQMDPQQLAALAGLLESLDPFIAWYWGIVLVGLSTTSQLRGWAARIICGLCWAMGALLRVGMLAAATGAGGPPQA